MSHKGKKRRKLYRKWDRQAIEKQISYKKKERRWKAKQIDQDASASR